MLSEGLKFWYDYLGLWLGLQAKPRPMKLEESTQGLRSMDTLHKFSAISYKGDNFYEFLFTFLHTNLLLKRGLL